MKFVSIRDFRSKTAAVRGDLKKEKEIVLTANGQPFAVLTPVSPGDLEAEIQAIRRARVRLAVERIRAAAKERGLDNLSMDEIDRLISRVRRERRKSSRRGE
jgi:antitoxin (DNA-binding transcriptional repressor) of toxin-antitoxin stability system